MAKDEQIDKISKKLFILSASEKKFAKREHRRLIRRKAKDIDNPNPQHNRYSGWIA
jgi:hypothetical protein